MLYQFDVLKSFVNQLISSHIKNANTKACHSADFGPYYPQRSRMQSSLHHLVIKQPQFQMFLKPQYLETAHGVDAEYDAALRDYYHPYHNLVCLLLRVAVNAKKATTSVVELSTFSLSHTKV